MTDLNPLRHQTARDERSRTLAQGQSSATGLSRQTNAKALENGAEALLTKPIDFGTLRNEIDMRIETAA